MAKALAKLLKTDMMADLDMAALAQILRSRGRGKDTILAHITPQEAALLKKRGGRGSTNPDTGLPEFDDTVDIAEPPPAAEPAPTPEVSVPSSPDVAPAPAAETTPAFDAAQQQFTEQGGYAGSYAPEGYGRSAGQLAATTPAQAQETAAFVGAPSAAELQPPAAPTTAAPAQSKSLLDKLTSPAALSQLAKLGLAGGLGAYGASQSRQAQQQGQQAIQQKQAIAAPYQQQGQELAGAAQRGELTPANQQIIQAQRARLQQASANMGGVGTQQIESQISTLTNQLLQNQYQYGLQIMQVGDNIALGAINTQLQLDNQLAAANKSFYGSLAQLVGGSPSYTPTPGQTTPTTTVT